MAINIQHFFDKDPDSILDYVFDWSKWLQVGETIASKSFTHSDGIVINSSAITGTGTKVTVWIAGGVSKLEYCTCHIITSEGREEDCTMGFNIVNK